MIRDSQMVTLEKPLKKKAKVDFKLKYQIEKILHNKNYFICRCEKLIIAYCISTKTKTKVNVITDDYEIFLYPPYLFVCAIGQFLYLYTENSLIDED